MGIAPLKPLGEADDLAALLLRRPARPRGAPCPTSIIRRVSNTSRTVFLRASPRRPRTAAGRRRTNDCPAATGNRGRATSAAPHARSCGRRPARRTAPARPGSGAPGGEAAVTDGRLQPVADLVGDGAAEHRHERRSVDGHSATPRRGEPFDVALEIERPDHRGVLAVHRAGPRAPATSPRTRARRGPWRTALLLAPWSLAPTSAPASASRLAHLGQFLEGRHLPRQVVEPDRSRPGLRGCRQRHRS